MDCLGDLNDWNTLSSEREAMTLLLNHELQMICNFVPITTHTHGNSNPQ